MLILRMVNESDLKPLVLSLFLLCCVASVRAQGPTRPRIGPNLIVAAFGGWQTAQSGIDLRTIVLERTDPNYQMELKLVRFDRKAFMPRILHGRDLQLLNGASAKAFAEKSGAIAAINANYFDEKGRALAYLKTAEKEINRRVSKHALYTGIFGLSDGSPFIMHRNDFEPHQASEALQSGPLLLHHGAKVEVMRGLGRYARRALIGIDREGRVIVAVADAVFGGLSLDELQELFANPNVQLDMTELLNLDGGGSAQLYLKAGDFEESVAGTTVVPVAIGFFAKTH